MIGSYGLRVKVDTNKGAVMGKFEKFGKLLGDIAIFMYVYEAVIAVVLILLCILVVRYIKKRKSKGNDDKKKYEPMWISIIIVVGALILLVSPLIMGMFLQVRVI